MAIVPVNRKNFIDLSLKRQNVAHSPSIINESSSGQFARAGIDLGSLKQFNLFRNQIEAKQAISIQHKTGIDVSYALRFTSSAAIVSGISPSNSQLEPVSYSDFDLISTVLQLGAFTALGPSELGLDNGGLLTLFASNGHTYVGIEAIVNDTSENPYSTKMLLLVGFYKTKLPITEVATQYQALFNSTGNNQSPTPQFTYTITTNSMSKTINFNASASSDIDGSIVNYNWNFGDGSPEVNTVNPLTSHEFTSSGSYEVVLTVTDNDGATNQFSETIVIDLNEAPVADLVMNFISHTTSQSVYEADTSNSSDDSGITERKVDWGDGSAEEVLSGNTGQHTYTSEGNKTVVLTVTDGGGKTHQDTVQINVVFNVAPTASFTYSEA